MDSRPKLSRDQAKCQLKQFNWSASKFEGQRGVKDAGCRTQDDEVVAIADVGTQMDSRDKQTVAVNVRVLRVLNHWVI